MSEQRPLTPLDLYRLSLLSDARISPDGTRVAFVLRHMDEQRNDYIGNIYVVDRDGTMQQFTSGDKDAAPRWSPDGARLAFVSERKDEPQVYVMPAAGGEAIALTDLKHGAGVPFWSPDSTAVAFAGVVATDPSEDQRDDDKGEGTVAPTKKVGRASYKADGAGYIGNRRRHLFVADVETRTVTQITDGDWFDDDPAWSPDSRTVAFGTNREERWDVSPVGDIYRTSRSGGDAEQVTRGGAYARPAFSADGQRLLFIGHSDSDDVFAPGRIFSCALDGSDLRDELGDWDGSVGNEVLSDVVLPHDDHAVYVQTRPDGTYFIGSVEGRANIYRACGGRVEPVTEGRQSISDFSIADDGTVAYIASDSTHPAEVWVLEDGQPRRLTCENDAFLREVRVVEPERFKFRGADGTESDGWLLAPNRVESGKHPLLTYIHGGPQMAHGEAFFFEYQFLAGQGYGVFYPNIHGSSSYGRTYQTSIQGDWGNRDLQDVIAGTRVAMERAWVDAERVGILGGSYGGYMTLWAMGHTDLYKVGVSERCVSNLLSFFGTSDSGWVWDRTFGVTPESDAMRLWDMSPVKYMANVGGPLLIMQYEGDDRTPLEQGEQAFVALRRLGKTTEFVVFPEESHGLSRRGKPSRRVERMECIVDWFRRYL